MPQTKLCATSKANYPRIRHKPNNALCLCREKRCLFGKSKLQRRQKQSSVPQPKLCATKHGIGGPGVLWHIKSPVLPKAPSQSLRIQLALNSLIRTPVSLAKKHSKAKTGKLSPEFGFAEFWSFGTRLLHKRWLFRCQNVSPFCLTTLQKVEFPCFFKSSKTQALCHKPKLCGTNPSSVPQPKANYPRIRHQPNSCAFVSLQGKTLFIWQIKVAKTAKAKLCAREPKPTNSACAEFANQNAGFIGGKTFQGENRQTNAKSAAFCSFGTRQLHKLRVFRCQNVSPFCLTTLQKVEFPCFFKSSKTQALCHNQRPVPQPKANYPRIRHKPDNALCLCREKRCLFGKSKLQRRQKQSSVPQPKANYPRIRHSRFCAFVSLQGKTLFIWQIKVAKTAKAKLCATENKFPPNSWVFKPNFSYFQK